MSDFAQELNRRLSESANGLANKLLDSLSETTGVPLRIGKPGQNQGERKTDAPASSENRPDNPFADQAIVESAAVKLQRLGRGAGIDSSDPVEVMRALSRKNETELRERSGNPKASDSDVVAAFVLDKTVKLDSEKKLASVIGRSPDMNNANDFSRAIRQVKESMQNQLGAVPNNDSDFLKRVSHSLAAAQFQKAGVPAPSYEQIKK